MSVGVNVFSNLGVPETDELQVCVRSSKLIQEGNPQKELQWSLIMGI